MTNLSVQSCDRVTDIHWPAPSKEYSLFSPAMDFFTDFAVNRPLVIDADTTALEAEYVMKSTHVRMKLVLDREDRFVGVVSLHDLLHRKIVQKVAQGFTRDEIQVGDLMRTKAQLSALDFTDIHNVNIKSVLNNLSSYDEQHILVTDHQGKELRGMISAADIVRRLRLPIDLHGNITFRDVYQLIMAESLYTAKHGQNALTA